MDYSRLVAGTGLFASGLTAGAAAGFPLLVNHIFIKSDQGLSLNQRLALWHRCYSAGSKAIPVMAFPAAALYLTQAFAYVQPSSSKQALIGAAVLHLAIIPFTLLFIVPTNNLLVGQLDKVKADASTMSDEGQFAPLLHRWVQLHNVRVAMNAAGFAVGIAATLGYF